MENLQKANRFLRLYRVPRDSRPDGIPLQQNISFVWSKGGDGVVQRHAIAALFLRLRARTETQRDGRQDGGNLRREQASKAVPGGAMQATL